MTGTGGRYLGPSRPLPLFPPQGMTLRDGNIYSSFPHPVSGNNTLFGHQSPHQTREIRLAFLLSRFMGTFYRNLFRTLSFTEVAMTCALIVCCFFMRRLEFHFEINCHPGQSKPITELTKDFSEAENCALLSCPWWNEVDSGHLTGNLRTTVAK